MCWDNAWAESFNATLKNKRVHRTVYPIRKKAMNDIASWIELTYNHPRLHSALRYRTPNEVEYERQGHQKAAWPKQQPQPERTQYYIPTWN